MGQFGRSGELDMFTTETRASFIAFDTKTSLLKVTLTLLQGFVENCQLKKLLVCILSSGWHLNCPCVELPLPSMRHTKDEHIEKLFILYS